MRQIVIGDVHGCLEELKELLHLVEFSKDDLVVFAGDLIHKGPHSAETVKYVRSIPNRIFVTGNHDEKHVRWNKHEKIRLETGKENPMSHVEEYPSIQKGLTEEDINFLASGRLFYYAYDRLVVHAGVPSKLKTLPADEDFSKLSKRELSVLNLVLRIRFEDESGKMIKLGNEKPEHTFWADTYDGRFGHVIFGHQPFFAANPRRFENATGIDLGCVYGGWLGAIILHKDGKEEHASVKAKAAYSGKLCLSKRDVT